MSACGQTSFDKVKHHVPRKRNTSLLNDPQGSFKNKYPARPCRSGIEKPCPCRLVSSPVLCAPSVPANRADKTLNRVGRGGLHPVAGSPDSIVLSWVLMPVLSLTKQDRSGLCPNDHSSPFSSKSISELRYSSISSATSSNSLSSSMVTSMLSPSSSSSRKIT